MFGGIQSPLQHSCMMSSIRIDLQHRFIANGTFYVTRADVSLTLNDNLQASPTIKPSRVYVQSPQTNLHGHHRVILLQHMR